MSKKKVRLVGTLRPRTALWGNNEAASIMAFVIQDIVSIEMIPEEGEAAWVYFYSDGSANLYKIKPDAIAYVPVRPDQSSSLAYSGGTPKEINLDTLLYEKIRDLMEAALANEAEHQDRREK
ncbi:MAG: hypothetical protein HC913_11765 [Microscillaceae bacterium]|nr:hypothetical protein [Microscillaceae bacterium]